MAGKVLAHKVNGYNSVEVTDACTRSGARGGAVDVGDFEERLWNSLRAWKKAGRKGVWLTVDVGLAELIPVAVRAGFVFHHAEATHLVLTAWLAGDMENKLPPGPSHFIGVAGFVVNSKNQVLAIREKSGPSVRLKGFWKLPGGLVDRHEDIRDAVVREVKEETGIDTEFVNFATIQEIHHFEEFGGPARAGTTDLYCLCTLRVLDENQPIVPQEEEIAACQWMDVDEFLKIRYYAQEGTLYHAMYQSVAAVARGDAYGLGAKNLDFGIVKGKNTLYAPKL